jgi:ATP-dependent helicase HrpA
MRDGIPRPIIYPEALPITAHREQLLNLLSEHRVVVVAGETGSGKTTQLPKFCIEAGLAEGGRIACTQPRRVAALSISKRLAEELKVEWGREVGVKMRFTDKTRRETRIKVMTDGMLLNEIQSDRDLKAYSVILIDEAHERSLNIDFLIGYLRQLLQRRGDLKVIITSATIDTATFAKAFGGAPVVEVSGRMYPVETVYAPIDELLEETGELTLIDAVGRAVEEIITWNRPGDVLVFLPGEKDIREARDVIEGHGFSGLEILPLFGRLSANEQERIFKSSRRRKVILATNIAETSITIPGIRYVIDGGLARISRYSPGTHTRRLPIEKVAQSSAEQRKGRAGRLSDGVCIRLYSETDFAARPRFGTPEILRSNLADVILRMRVFGLGKIREFPFIDPPSERAIKAGHELLWQLGALDEKGGLTALGRKLAHLPVDPTVGRMLLEAQKEGCVREILVIAAGISIQDPRERPMEAAKEADTMHARFRHKESDFLTLLNIWESYHDEMDRLSQNQLRKFCKGHYLSYLRMREWRDIHHQLERTLKDLGDLRINKEPAEYDQIHRALLAGLLVGVAQFEEGNIYRAVRNRKVMIFPGSTLFRKEVMRTKGKGGGEAKAKGRKAKARWIMSAETMETSRLYARTVARIEPEWILRVGKDVLKHSYTDPYYEESSERVLVRERVLLFGLEVAVKRTAHVRVRPLEATEIFIREALVGRRLKTQAPFFLANNELVDRLQDRQTRLRSASSWALEERLYQFYANQIKEVGSYADLRGWLKREHGGKETTLLAAESDLLDTSEDSSLEEAFPDATQLNGLNIPLEYVYRPGEEDDGVTLKVPVDQFERVDPELLDWAVPGFVRQRVEHLLRGLPKERRKVLFPLADIAAELAALVRPGAGTLVEQMTRLLEERRGVRLFQEEWDTGAIPEHLRPRIEIVDKANQSVASGRDWTHLRSNYEAAVKSALERGEGADHLTIWKEGKAKWARSIRTLEEVGNLPEVLTLGDVAGVPVRAYPGLAKTESAWVIRLFPERVAAEAETRKALPSLSESHIGRELAWFERDLGKELKRVSLGFAAMLDGTRLQEEVMGMVRRSFFFREEVLPITANDWCAELATVQRGLRGLAPRVVDQLQAVLQQRDSVFQKAGTSPAWMAELNALVHRNSFRSLRLDQLDDWHRYLKALEIRIERARKDPQKDARKAQPLQEWIRRYTALKGVSAKEKRRLRWLLEEYKVQVFAQELGTREKVSEKLLQATFAGLENNGV